MAHYAMREGRHEPDELLKSVQPENTKKAKLKIFLGASAGVGKTYAMLSEAHEQAKMGLNVAIGFVESHGRDETLALTHGLPQIPLQKINYRNITLSEVNVDAIIAAHPDLVLIDELAHSCAPGSRHTKRWQDVEDVLSAGINVYTAVNVQHLESLNDVVVRVTGVRVSETVPDSFFDRADAIEVVDIPPAELQQRLSAGKVYIAEKIDQALEGFFKTSNLTFLREMALRRAADKVDAEMQKLRAEQGAKSLWVARERVVVCVAPNSLANRVVREAARLGAATHAELIAVSVESDRQIARTEEDHSSAEIALSLAGQLGMEVVRLQGHDIVSEIVTLANRRNANLIVVGKPIRPRWRELIFGSVVDELVRRSGDVDVHVITSDIFQKATNAKKFELGAVSARGVGLVVAVTAAAIILGLFIFQSFGISNVAMVFVLGVAFCSTKVSPWESAVSALLGVVSFDFFFVEPRFNFAVSDARYVVVFGVMLAVALVISSLTHQLRSQLLASSKRERMTASLYSLSQKLVQSRSRNEIAAAAVREIQGNFDGDVAVYVQTATGLILIERSVSQFEQEPSEMAVAAWVAKRGLQAGLATDTLQGSKAIYLPLKGTDSTVGVLAFRPDDDLKGFTQKQSLEMFANSLGLALERAELAEASNNAKVLADSELIRSTLLSSISHDLRTPLTSITGAASSLISGAANQSELIEAIYSESVRLNQQIQNILDVTRLQSSGVVLDKKWHSVGDLISSALRHTQGVLRERTVKLSVPAEAPMVLVDGLLIEKALINLLENVSRHTGLTDSIQIRADFQETKVQIEIQDSGPGIDLDLVFNPDFKGRKDSSRLGLAIVKAIMDLHGGEVKAENRNGACFTLVLSLPDHQPEIPNE